MKRSLQRVVAIIWLAFLAQACSKHEEKPIVIEPPAPRHADEYTGEGLFILRCRDCHKLHETGGQIGPDLSGIGALRSRAYLEQVMREPAKIFPGTAMPSCEPLSFQQVDLITDYLTR